MFVTISQLFITLDFIQLHDSVTIKKGIETLFEGEFLDVPYNLYAESPVTVFDFANGDDADTTYIAYIE